MSIAKGLLRAFKAASGRGTVTLPQTLILFVTSKCNMQCEHCFYWEELNGKDDLTFEEIERLISIPLGKLGGMNLSGGEPFLRGELVEILSMFRKNNGLEAVSIPTNGYMPELVERKTRELLRLFEGAPLYITLSIDGTEAVHNRIRHKKNSFERVNECYRRLVALKKRHGNLRLQINPTISDRNIADLYRLTDHVAERMGEIDSYSLTYLRGSPKDPSYGLPPVEELRRINDYLKEKFPQHRRSLQRAINDTLFDIKLEAIVSGRQVVPCVAGNNIGVVYANGDVAHCEMLPPIGNLRERSFHDLWFSSDSQSKREAIARGECACTHECFLFPSLQADVRRYPTVLKHLIFPS